MTDLKACDFYHVYGDDFVYSYLQVDKSRMIAFTSKPHFFRTTMY